MSIVSRQYDKKEEGTVFRHAVSGKLLCRLDAKLTRFAQSGVSRRHQYWQ